MIGVRYKLKDMLERGVYDYLTRVENVEDIFDYWASSVLEEVNPG